MTRSTYARTLLAGSALLIATSAIAQTQPTPTAQPEAMPDQSDAAADAAIKGAAATDDA